MLDKSMDYTILDEIKSKYSKEEFYRMLSILPLSLLREPIRANPRMLVRHIPGFRAQHLPLKLVCRFYYERIY